MIKPSEFRNYAILLSTIDENPAFIKMISPHNIKALDDAGYLQGKKLSASGHEFVKLNIPAPRKKLYEKAPKRTFGPQTSGRSPLSAPKQKPVPKPKPPPTSERPENSQVASIFDFTDLSVAPNPKRKRVTKVGQKRVSKKISKLVHEDYPVNQAAAIAYKYERSGKLGPRGGKRNPKSGAKQRDQMLTYLVKLASEPQTTSDKIPSHVVSMMEHLGWIKVKNQKASLTDTGQDVIKYIFEGAE